MKARLLAVCIATLISSQLAVAQEYAKQEPTDEHKKLKDQVGTWDAEILIYMAPDQEPAKSKGVENVKMLGEFWTVIDFKYKFMDQPTFGHGMIGYDPVRKKFIGNWFESTSAYPSDMEGTYDETTGKITYKMKSQDETGKEVEYKVVTSQPDRNTRTFTMFSPVADQPNEFTKMVDINYKRRTAQLR